VQKAEPQGHRAFRRSAPAARRPPFFSRIAVRLLAFNLLLVFLPVAGFLYLDTYERQLLRSLEHALAQQARVLAASLSGRGRLTVDAAAAPLRALERRHEARFRIVDPEGRLLADSSRLEHAEPSPSPAPSAATPGAARAREAPSRDADSLPLYRLASFPIRLARRLFAPPEPPYESGEFYSGVATLLGEELRAALAGGYGAATRISAGGQRSVTLYSAVPVMDRQKVTGAVLVSQSTYRILRDLYELRLRVFEIFLVSVGAAVILSLVAGTTIVRPLAHLRRQAGQILDGRGRLRGHFRLPARRDEIGELARALRELTRRLEAQLAFGESFAADLSHELKNPLASIRAAAELVPAAGSEERARFLSVIQQEVARLEALLARVRDIAWIDARLEEEPRERLDAAELAERCVESLRLRRPDLPAFRVLVSADAASDQSTSARPFVRLSPHRLLQVFENLMDNAAGFAPAGSEVEVTVRREGPWAVLRVADCGPGIPPEHLQRIFDRFFSYRPAVGADRQAVSANVAKSSDRRVEHPGLGLAIVKAIVEGYGGTVCASNREGGGAVFQARLPAD
jgi:two-component system sensor histidine kinase ChvG